MKRHPERVAERAEGRAEALIIVLAEGVLEPTEDERRRILEERDAGRLERWLAAARTCADVAGLRPAPMSRGCWPSLTAAAFPARQRRGSRPSLQPPLTC